MRSSMANADTNSRHYSVLPPLTTAVNTSQPLSSPCDYHLGVYPKQCQVHGNRDLIPHVSQAALVCSQARSKVIIILQSIHHRLLQ